MDDLAADRQIARSLRTTWEVFFGRHGRLLSSQRMAIPPILQGKNVLLTSPTASGKTEAALAPLIERYQSKAAWTVLYVVPTRALVNDLYQRLISPCDQLSIRLYRRTGEYRNISQVPNLLLTTPESFDSMLCRGRMRQGHILSNVQAIVLDEIHLLSDTGRGEQTRWLIQRLERLLSYGAERGWNIKSPLQKVALSASLRDPQNVARKFLGEDAHVVSVTGQRLIELIDAEHISEPVHLRIEKYLNSVDHPQKVIIFSNARDKVDILSFQLRNHVPSGYTVVAHHGSLSKSMREDAEDLLRRLNRVVVSCTSTLEIGIDIGDIDVVALDGAAPDIGSFLQRIGRGNRRSGKTKVLLCSNRSRDPLIHRAMVFCASSGDFGGTWGGLHFAAAIQQIGSYILQSPTRHRSKDSILELASSMLSDVHARELVLELLRNETLIEDGSGITLGLELQRRAETGRIHTVIEDPPAMEVKDAQTGKSIAVNVMSAAGNQILIGGRVLDVQSVRDRTIDVRSGSFSDDLGPVGYRTARSSPGLAQPYAIRKYLGIPDNVWPYVETDRCLLVFHLGGFQVHRVLETMCSVSRYLTYEGNDFIFTADRRTSNASWLKEISYADCVSRIDQELERFERLLQRPEANLQLPRVLRVEEVLSWLAIEETMRRIRDAQWSKVTDPETVETLLSVLKA